MRCCLLVLLAAPLVSAERLDQVRGAVRSPSTASSTTTASSSSSCATASHSDDDGFLSCLVSGFFEHHDDCGRRAATPARTCRLDDPPELRAYPEPYAGEPPTLDAVLAVEGGWQDDLGRLGARFGFATSQGAMDAGLDRFYERDASGSSRWDRLDLWRLDGALTLVSSRTVALRLGAAGLLLHDPHGNDGGLAATLGVHVGGFVGVEPLGADAALEYGFLGRARYLRLRSELGWRLGALEPIAGYDYLRIDEVALQGPFAGLRWHF